MRINQYIAHSGLCSRRQADVLIKEGRVKVNGQLVENIGILVQPTDKVTVDGKTIKPEKHIYILLNKPRNTITSTVDDKNRKTIIDLIEPQLHALPNVPKVRLYPVGRLDRNTTGLILLTNDGELTNQLTHPKFEIEKIYIAELDRDMTIEDMETLAMGIELEDGPIHADEIAYSDPKQKNKIGIVIHSGRNRIVRRMFEHLNYQVKYLDRIVFAGLTKKNLPRASWRFLTEYEVMKLKNLVSSSKKFVPPAHTFKKTKVENKIYKIKL